MTPTDIHIPAASLEAGARAALTAAFQIEPDARVHELTMDEYASIARAAFLAMIEKWPGMKLENLCGWVMDGDDLPYVEEAVSIILPLPTQEPGDAE